MKHKRRNGQIWLDSEIDKRTGERREIDRKMEVRTNIKIDGRSDNLDQRYKER